MDASAFDENLGKALRLCRLAADLGLPIEEMLDYVEGERAELLPAGPEMLAPDADHPEARELAALGEIIATVGEVAAIGSKLPAAEPSPAELACPLPANLRRST